MIDGDVRDVPCPKCGVVMNGWAAFGPPEQVTFCRSCETYDEAFSYLRSRAATAALYGPVSRLRGRHEPA